MGTVESARPLPPRTGQLSAEEEKALAERWRAHQDERALARLVGAHLGLVVHIAMEFRHSGPSMDDLIQEGNLGLIIAARRFDPSRQTRLVNFAASWVRGHMLEHVVRSHGPVRIGTNGWQRRIFFGFTRARRKLELSGKTVDSDTLALALGVKRDDVEAMAPRLRGHDRSLDAPHGSGSRRAVAELLAGSEPSPEEILAEQEETDLRRCKLFAGIGVLDERERAIIRARHMCRRPATHAALAKRLGISSERVRQLEWRAKIKLRAFCGVARSEGSL
jgi:RNA polymerase sigma-32 factor